MKEIRVFSDSALYIEKIADKNDELTAVVVEAMIEALKENDIDIEEYL